MTLSYKISLNCSGYNVNRADIREATGILPISQKILDATDFEQVCSSLICDIGHIAYYIRTEGRQ